MAEPTRAAYSRKMTRIWSRSAAVASRIVIEPDLLFKALGQFDACAPGVWQKGERQLQLVDRAVRRIQLQPAVAQLFAEGLEPFDLKTDVIDGPAGCRGGLASVDFNTAARKIGGLRFSTLAWLRAEVLVITGLH